MSISDGMLQTLWLNIETFENIMFKRKLVFIIFALFPCFLRASLQIGTTNTDRKSFPLSVKGVETTILVDDSDFEVVKKSALFLSEDIFKITTNKHKVTHSNQIPKTKNIILIGTLGHNSLIDILIKNGKLDVDAIENGWEQYIIKTIEKPFPNIDKVLVIAGSDRRGTAYGVFTLSEQIGVSPWYWWADVSVQKKQSLYVSPVEFSSKTPTVKYRGIFLNDEGWGLHPWAAKTFDRALGDIGPKTYSKICELILRLKGNMLAPAMHPCSGAFNKYENNKLVADSFAIVMTSAHCEPLLFNNATEWDKATMGEWNYKTNKDGINKVLNQRVKDNIPYENIYTIAMRGIHDEGILGVPESEQVKLLEEVANDQRQIIANHTDKSIETIPQIFVPYKEVLTIYEQGLAIPDDITLVWPDDNFGYIKRLSTEEERKRTGGAGVYYHISYLGLPHDYLWLNTTSPALMYGEMYKAYLAGADRYWLLNVGDIKPGEYGVQLFLDMGWDIDQFSFENLKEHESRWFSSKFGTQYSEQIADIMNSYYHLAFQRKPEYMGWGLLWNTDAHFEERLSDTEFSFVNYQEATRRIVEYNRIAKMAETILEELPLEHKASFYQLVYYPVVGSALMTNKMLAAQQNRWYARQGRAATNYMADQTNMYHDSINLITQNYNSLLHGKWNYMMELAPGWEATYQNLPPTSKINLDEVPHMELFVLNSDYGKGRNNMHILPCFNTFLPRQYPIEIYNKGKSRFYWKAKPSSDWIILSKDSGEVLMQDEIMVSIDWNSVPYGDNLQGEIIFSTGKHQKTVYLTVFNPEKPTKQELHNLYIEDNGYVSINAGDFHRTTANEQLSIQLINGLGIENQSVQLGKPLEPYQAPHRRETVHAEYDFYTFSAGMATIYTYALPVFAINKQHGTGYGIMIDDGTIHVPQAGAAEYSQQWYDSVLRNYTLNTCQTYIDKPGKHTLKLIVADPGMVIQKIVIDFGGLKTSYLGPLPTKVNANHDQGM